MNYDEFMRIVERSDIEDWIGSQEGTYTSRDDLLITLRENKATAGSAYYEWTKNYQNPESQRVDWELCYNGACIERFAALRVDGGRMYIPLPDENLQISDRQRRIGYIINTANRTDFLRYLDLARITVRDPGMQRENGPVYTYTS